jgi:hypothetical protein
LFLREIHIVAGLPASPHPPLRDRLLRQRQLPLNDLGWEIFASSMGCRRCRPAMT